MELQHQLERERRESFNNMSMFQTTTLPPHLRMPRGVDWSELERLARRVEELPAMLNSTESNSNSTGTNETQVVSEFWAQVLQYVKVALDEPNATLDSLTQNFSRANIPATPSAILSMITKFGNPVDLSATRTFKRSTSQRPSSRRTGFTRRPTTKSRGRIKSTTASPISDSTASNAEDQTPPTSTPDWSDYGRPMALGTWTTMHPEYGTVGVDHATAYLRENVSEWERNQTKSLETFYVTPPPSSPVQRGRNGKDGTHGTNGEQPVAERLSSEDLENLCWETIVGQVCMHHGSWQM